MAVQRSVVKWFDAKKGYGFIVHPQGESDVFVHYSQIETDRRFKTLRTGQIVDFVLEDGPKGLHAKEVVPHDEPQDEPQEVRMYEAPQPSYDMANGDTYS